MGWQIGFDSHWNRDIGYGVPAICDRPKCGANIDRGLSFVCGSEPRGGEHGCGLYFCDRHLTGTRKSGHRRVRVCGRCDKNRLPYAATPDTAEWLNWKLTDESWAPWRQQNPEQAERIRVALAQKLTAPCRSCAEIGWALCPDGYCPDCCDGCEHNHEPARTDAEAGR